MRQSLHMIVGMICIGTCIALSSCKSSKPVVNPNSPIVSTNTTFAADKYMSMVASNNSTQANLTAKVKVVVDVDGKSVSTSGSLKMKKDDVMIYAVQYFSSTKYLTILRCPK